MEFVGRMFEKQFNGTGVVQGVVNSYDQSSGLFKVSYEDGNAEELELSEVSMLITEGISFDEQSGSDGIRKRRKKASRKPKKRRRLQSQNPEPGQNSAVLTDRKEDGDCSAVNRKGYEANDSDMNGSANGLSLNNDKNGFVNHTLDASSDHEGNSRGDDDGVSAMQTDGKDIEATDNGTLPQIDTFTSAKRRSSRLAATHSAQNNVSNGERTVADSEVLQSSVLNSVEEFKVGKPETSDHKESHCDYGIPAKLQLPPSSEKLNLDGMPVFDLFSIYAFLRSFGTILFLSPFEFERFVSSLKSNAPNLLIDSIHVSLLQTLRKHLELLSGENSLSASKCLRSLNWDLLDLITWPTFLVEYFLMHGSALDLGFDIHELKNLCENDYYKQPYRVKIEILQYLCDDVIQAESIISEINKRAMLIDSNVDGERNAKSELSLRKRKMDVSGNSYLGEEVDEDGNIDECCLCKMDGSLICCDGCPAAYHMKCVGIASSDLPEGDWHCHECMIDKKNPWAKLGKSIRGAEALGVDPHGRLYYSSCGYLLVFDPYGDEPTYHWYCPNDVTMVINVLKTLQSHYNEIMQAIATEWSICIVSVGSKINMHAQNVDNCIDLKEQMPVIETTNIFMKMEIPSSPGEALQTIHADSLQDSGADGREILNNPNGSFGSALVANGGGEIQSIDCKQKLNLIDARNGDRLQELETDYLNFYSFALWASSVVEELATQNSSDKAGVAFLKSKEDVISTQLKAISRKSNKFFWPNIPNISVGARKENCGWCFSCRSPDYGGGCFCNMNNSGPSIEKFTSMAVGFCSQQLGGKGHLADVACYILFMEDRLLGLLSGPWLNPHYSKLWRQSLRKATNVADLKQLLLLLELNLNRRALSEEWLKQVDTVSTLGSACHIVINKTHVSLKHGSVRKRGRPSLVKTTISSNTSDGLCLLWWRGGKVSQHLFNWKVLPRSIASKAARRGSCIRIPDLSYSDGPEFSKRKKRIAWQAAIESSRNVDQLALQVRELDANIRWDEIENTCLLSKGGHLRKSIRQPFNKVIVRRKWIDGTVAKYLLDFGKRKNIPEIVLSHGVIFEESANDKRKYWLEESNVPLHLLRNFELKKVIRKSNDITSRKHGKIAGIRNKQKKKDIFSYLFSKAKKAETNKCGECSEDVLIREAVSCQQCKGFFHKIHARVSNGTEDVANGIFTCQKCSKGVESCKVKKNDVAASAQSSTRVKVVAVQKKKSSTSVKAVTVQKKKSSTSVKAVAVQKKKSSTSVKAVAVQKNTSSTSVKAVAVQKNTSSTSVKAVAVQKKKSPIRLIDVAVPKKKRSTRVKAVAVQKKKIGEENKEKASRGSGRWTPTKKPNSTWRRKRTCFPRVYWVNGFQLSEIANDERVMNFRSKKLVIASECTSSLPGKPKCGLCGETEFTSALNYLACETCRDWFHGDAFGLNEDKIGKVIGFKCHKCLKAKTPPVCPHHPDERAKLGELLMSSGGTA